MPNQDWDEDDAIDGAEDAAEDEGDGDSSDYAVVRDADEQLGGRQPQVARVNVTDGDEEEEEDEEGAGGHSRADREEEASSGFRCW